jgi:hypothetical protein
MRYKHIKKYRIPLLLWLSLSVLLPSEGLAMAQAPDYKEQIKEKYKKVDLSDGVSKEEAIIIAQNYLIERGIDKTYKLESAEVFGEDDPFWDKNSWHIGFYTKLGERLKTGLKWCSFHVDKKTGSVLGGGCGPS